MIGFLVTGFISAISMVWLFWHYPLSTGVATLVILAAFAISARLARLIESDGRSDMVRNKHRV